MGWGELVMLGVHSYTADYYSVVTAEGGDEGVVGEIIDLDNFDIKA